MAYQRKYKTISVHKNAMPILRNKGLYHTNREGNFVGRKGRSRKPKWDRATWEGWYFRRFQIDIHRDIADDIERSLDEQGYSFYEK